MDATYCEFLLLNIGEATTLLLVPAWEDSSFNCTLCSLSKNSSSSWLLKALLFIRNLKLSAKGSSTHCINNAFIPRIFGSKAVQNRLWATPESCQRSWKRRVSEWDRFMMVVMVHKSSRLSLHEIYLFRCPRIE
jgi:hypothetical protein